MYMLLKIPFRLLVVYSAIYIASTMYFQTTIPSERLDSEQVLEVTGTNQIKIDGDRLRGFVQYEGEFIYVTYRISSEEEKMRLERFQWQDAVLRLRLAPSELQRPSHPYAFQMAHYLKMNRANHYAEIIEFVHLEEQKTWRSTLESWREQLRQQIEHIFPQGLHWEAKALLIGDKSDFTTEINEQLQILGISHLLAISGLHVSLVMLLIRGTLLRLRMTHETTHYLLLVALPLYAMIAGASPSVLRASLMAFFVLLFLKPGSKLSPIDALSYSAIALLFWKPTLFYFPGFQLSYGAALTIILSAQLLRRVENPVIQLFLISLFTQLSLYPILLFHFYEFSVSSIVINILYVPIYSSFVLPSYLIILCTSYFLPLFSKWYVMIFVPIQRFLLQVTGMLAELPYQMWVGGAISVTVMGGITLSILYAFIALERKQWKRAIFIFVIPFILLESRPYWNEELVVTFIDVGQGDSILIELPHRQGVYLVDAGGVLRYEQKEAWKERQSLYEVGRQVVVPLLKAKQITTLDTLFVTHADSDHMEGADEVMERVRPKLIVYPPGSEQKELMAELLNLADERKIAHQPITAPKQWQVGKTTFRLLWPHQDAIITDDNDRSLVLEIIHGEYTILLMGDLEEEMERRLAKNYERRPGTYVLKAGHHGSRTSTTEEWVQATRPDEAVISAGRHNRYGHPHEEVIERLKSHQVNIRSTAEEGTIEYRFK